MSDELVPDMVLVSGRESLDLRTRVELLHHEVETIKAQPCSAADVHDRVNMCGFAGNWKLFYENGLFGRSDDEHRRRGEPTNLELVSAAECDVMAWKRGGREEHSRIRKLQRAVWAERKKTAGGR